MQIIDKHCTNQSTAFTHMTIRDVTYFSILFFWYLDFVFSLLICVEV